MNTYEEALAALEKKYAFVPGKKALIRKERLTKIEVDIKNLNSIDSAKQKLLETIDNINQQIAEGVVDHDKIMLVQDSDCDGIGTHYIMNDTFTKIMPHGTFMNWITSRAQGYGLLPLHVEYAHEHGYSLIITADCGISSMEAVTRANELGISVIITDHHTAQLPDSGEEYDPDANPTNSSDDASNDRNISNKLVPDTPWLVCSELSPEFESRYVSGTVVIGMFLSYCFDEIEFDDYLPEYGLTTISDMMPMNTHYNYTLVVLFLDIFTNNNDFMKYVATRQYLITFMDVQEIHAISVTDVGFQLSPRINSANRADEQDVAGEFIREQDPTVSKELYDQLTEYNDKRKEVQVEVTERVIAENEAYLNEQRANGNFIIVTLGQEMIRSTADRKVFGLIANKLVKDYNLPAMVLGYSSNSHSYSGSGRSPWPVIDTLNQLKDFNTHLGGHAAAFGIGVKADRLDEYKETLGLNATLTYQKQNPTIDGLIVKFEDATQTNLRSLHDFIEASGPYGIGWKRPNIIFENPNFTKLTRIGKQKQFNKFSTKIKGGAMEVIDFSPHRDFADVDMVAHPPKYVSGNLSVNEFRGKSKVDLLVDKMTY